MKDDQYPNHPHTIVVETKDGKKFKAIRYDKIKDDDAVAMNAPLYALVEVKI